MSSTITVSSVELQRWPSPTPQPVQSTPMPRSSAFELPQEGNFEDTGETGQYLAPVDRGPAAWRLLIVAFIFEAFFWGNISTFEANLYYVTNTQTLRFSTFFWGLSELLLQPSTVCGQSVYSHCWDCCIWNFLSRSTACHSPD